ncbi:MAG: molecular chaperone DnaJ [Chloroflexi bacterium]|nr:molecular chaperone DnaJ [Chloroflexota bacterium]
MDYYDIMGLDRSASQDDIKKAYKNMARKHHPDVSENKSEAEENFKKINEAYSVLSDPDKRRLYDQYGFVPGENSGGQRYDGGFPFEDMFEGGLGDIFGAFFDIGVFDIGGRSRSRSRTRGPERGDDIRVDLELTLEDAYNGVSKEVSGKMFVRCDNCNGEGAEPGSGRESCPVCSGTGEITRTQNTLLGRVVQRQLCPNCRGEGILFKNPCKKCKGEGRYEKKRTLTVEIPPGVEDGMKIRLSGEGEAGWRGGPPGNLYVYVHMKEHPVFKRSGDTLYTVKPVSITQASLGAEIQINTLNGPETVHIPAGTQHGHVFTIREKGMPDIRSGSKGDLMVEVKVMIPTRLSGKQKDLLAEFAELSGEKPGPEKGFFDKLKDSLTP